MYKVNGKALYLYQFIKIITASNPKIYMNTARLHQILQVTCLNLQWVHMIKSL